MADQRPLLAILIDADNTSPQHAKAIFDEIAAYGEASVRRVYGDFSSSQMKGWSKVQAEFGLVPHHQPANTVGKNASDIALVIDAMDLLHSARFDGFVLVSSDSDFTRLASRLRESGKTVYGFGEKKTPKPFVEACDKFTYTEILRTEIEAIVDEPAKAPVSQKSANDLKGDTKLVNLLRNSVEDSSGEDGWANLADVGQTIQNVSPDFDARNYGFKKLSGLFRAIGLFDIEEKENPSSQVKVLYVRDKRLNK